MWHAQARSLTATAAAAGSGPVAKAGQGELPPPLNIEHFVTALNSRRQASPIRALMPLLQLPGMISLGGGLPNPALVGRSLRPHSCPRIAFENVI